MMNNDVLSEKEKDMLQTIAYGIGANVGDIEYLFLTLKHQGNVSRVDFNQLLGLGIPLINPLSEIKGMSNAAVVAGLNSGVITIDDIECAFRKLVEPGGPFYDLPKPKFH